MGCRGLVIFHDDKDNYSPTIYTHWGGDNIETDLETCKQQMGENNDEVDYTAARMVEVMCRRSPGERASIGIWNTPADIGTYDADKWKEYSHGDHGIYLVDVRDFSFIKYA